MRLCQRSCSWSTVTPTSGSAARRGLQDLLPAEVSSYPPSRACGDPLPYRRMRSSTRNSSARNAAPGCVSPWLPRSNRRVDISLSGGRHWSRALCKSRRRPVSCTMVQGRRRGTRTQPRRDPLAPCARQFSRAPSGGSGRARLPRRSALRICAGGSVPLPRSRLATSPSGWTDPTPACLDNQSGVDSGMPPTSFRPGRTANLMNPGYVPVTVMVPSKSKRAKSIVRDSSVWTGPNLTQAVLFRTSVARWNRRGRAGQAGAVRSTPLAPSRKASEAIQTPRVRDARSVTYRVGFVGACRDGRRSNPVLLAAEPEAYERQELSRRAERRRMAGMAATFLVVSSREGERRVYKARPGLRITRPR